MPKEEKVIDNSSVKIIYPGDIIAKENWEVCHRMFIHDLLDMANENPVIKAVLDIYSIRYYGNGGYTMALPRIEVLERNGFGIGRKSNPEKYDEKKQCGRKKPKK